MALKKEEKEEVVKVTTSKKPLAPTNATVAPRKKVTDMRRVTSTQPSADEFLKRLRASQHAPLQKPAPKKVRGPWNIALSVFIGLALAASAGAAVYYFVIIPRDEGKSAAPEAPISTDGDLSVGIEGAQISMGAPATISYNLSSKVEGKAQLYLVDAQNTLTGRIAEVPAGTSSFKWNPQDVRSEDGVSSEAPVAGSYRILLAIRPEGDTRPATELETKATSDAFALSYDVISPAGEVSFETCLDLASYSKEQWYAGLGTAATAQGIALEKVTVSCYSPAGGVLIFAASGEGIMGYPLVARFDTKTGMLREAVYTGIRDEELTGALATFGRRDGTTVPVIVNGVTTFTYDFVKNVFEDAE